MRDGKMEQLRRVPMLRACSEAELRRLAWAAEMITVPTGAVMQVEDDEVRWFYLVLAGDVDVEQGERMVGSSGVGTTVGEVELLCGSPAMHTVTAASPVRAVVLSRPQFNAVLDDCPVFRDAIVRSLARGLAAAVADRSDHGLVAGPWRPRPVPAPFSAKVSRAHPSVSLRPVPARLSPSLSPTPSIGA
jgi:CRP-like cAMP-binding protein